MENDTIYHMCIIKFDEKLPFIPAKRLEKFMDIHEDDLPEDCFLPRIMELYENDAELRCHNCATSNDDDAKFCKECGTKIQLNDRIFINDLSWYGNESAELFNRIFLKKVVPMIKGKMTCMISYAENSLDLKILPKCKYFVVEDGKIEWFSSIDVSGEAQSPEFYFQEEPEEDDELDEDDEEN